jgi:ubiquinone/menaquinone biosynthesis C-methylase UbiE
LVTGIEGSIESEHLHRYFLAREFCRGKDVLDVASGEGYGAALLAQTAKRVIGVDVDSASVEHASCAYHSANLCFIQGDAATLPLETRSVDVIVSFETIEHFSEHEIFLSEVQRVLRPDGFLIVSTPDMNVYSAAGTAPNPFHVRELTEVEFCAELRAAFCNVALLRQRAITGSAILPDAAEFRTSESWVYEQRDANTFESHRHLPRAPYLIAVASNAAMPAIGESLYIRTVNLTEPNAEVQAELERLRNVEAAGREQTALLTKALADAAAIREQLNTSARLARQQALVVRRFQQELQAAREETSRYILAYNEACDLIIPLWMRRSLPEPLKRALRALKRVLRLTSSGAH